MSLTNMIQAFTQAAGIDAQHGYARCACATCPGDLTQPETFSDLRGPLAERREQTKPPMYRYTWRSPIAPATPSEAAAGD
jgi:hypothetical protein